MCFEVTGTSNAAYIFIQLLHISSQGIGGGANTQCTPLSWLTYVLPPCSLPTMPTSNALSNAQSTLEGKGHTAASPKKWGGHSVGAVKWKISEYLDLFCIIAVVHPLGSNNWKAIGTWEQHGVHSAEWQWLQETLGPSKPPIYPIMCSWQEVYLYIGLEATQTNQVGQGAPATSACISNWWGYEQGKCNLPAEWCRWP